MDYYLNRLRVRESATYLVETDGGEQAAYLLWLCELPDGRWTVRLMASSWEREAENTFPDVEQACAAADRLYAMTAAGERWAVRRWGWTRPGTANAGRPAAPHPRHADRL